MVHGLGMVPDGAACVNRMHPNATFGAATMDAMTAIPAALPGLRRREGRGPRRARRPRFAEADLPPGEVEVRVAWSSVNYKDGLATRADGKVARISPLIPGIDLAGEVVASLGPGRSPWATRSWPTATTSACRATAGSASTSGCRPAGSCRCAPGLSAARGDGDRHGRLHGGDVGGRSRGPRAPAGRRAGPGHRRVGRGGRHGPRHPGRSRLRGLGGDRQGRGGGTTPGAWARPGSSPGTR